MPSPRPKPLRAKAPIGRALVLPGDQPAQVRARLGVRLGVRDRVRVRIQVGPDKTRHTGRT